MNGKKLHMNRLHVGVDTNTPVFIQAYRR